jgi:hypothetical protein
MEDVKASFSSLCRVPLVLKLIQGVKTPHASAVVAS